MERRRRSQLEVIEMKRELDALMAVTRPMEGDVFTLSEDFILYDETSESRSCSAPIEASFWDTLWTPTAGATSSVVDGIAGFWSSSIAEQSSIDEGRLDMLRATEEIITSERRYVTILTSIVRFSEFFVSYGKEFSNERLHPLSMVVFGNIHDIYKLHVGMLEKLEEIRCCDERIMSQSPDMYLVTGVVAIFKQYGPFLKMYFQYLSNYSNASEELLAYRSSNEGFSKLLKVLERVYGDTISSLLIQPIQRLPRYRLLLERISKHATRLLTDDEARELHSTSDLICGIAGKLDHDMEMKERRHKVVHIQQNIFKGKLELVTASRYFVRMGVLNVNPKPHTRDKLKLYQAILFNDLFLYGKFSKARVSIKMSLDLNELSVVSQPNGDFHIFHTTNQYPILISPTDAKDGTSWLDDICKHVTLCQSRRSSGFGSRRMSSTLVVRPDQPGLPSTD